MNAALKTKPKPQQLQTPIEPQVDLRDGGMPYHWTREVYEQLVSKGVFGEDDKLELIGGEIVTMSPQRSPHATAISLVEEALRPLFAPRCYVRVQMPFTAGDDSQPEPDIAVVEGRARDFKDGHPAAARLIVEISDTTIASDRTVKAGLYASAGVPEYWIVNLVDNLLEVHRQPAPMTGQPFGHHYKSIERLSAEESVTALGSSKPMAVRDLLP